MHQGDEEGACGDKTSQLWAFTDQLDVSAPMVDPKMSYPKDGVCRMFIVIGQGYGRYSRVCFPLIVVVQIVLAGTMSAAGDVWS